MGKLGMSDMFRNVMVREKFGNYFMVGPQPGP